MDELFQTNTTFGDLVGRILAIKEKEEMIRFSIEYTAWLTEQKVADPIKVMQANIGWCFGEGMPEQRWQMWNEACGAAHPLFGLKRMTPEELMQAGKDYAMSLSHGGKKKD